jgi:hypothetical protein
VRRVHPAVVALCVALAACAGAHAQTAPPPKSGTAPAKPPATAAKKKSAPKPTVASLSKQLQEQKALVEQQAALVEEQRALLTEQQARIADQDAKLTSQEAEVEAQRALVTELQAQLAELKKRLDELEQLVPQAAQQEALDERLKRIEEASQKVPELASTMVSAGDFPGSIRIPGTDAAIKFGGRIRTALVFTLDALGSDDRFLTNSIPVEPDDAAAGKGKRTTFTANTSRFNFEMRTPTGVGQMRAFIEGDFFGSTGTDARTAFRLRHAFAQFKGILIGQTWSTFSDPAANHQDLDFEGINGENVIRQPQVRYTWKLADDFEMAAALETPQVSLTGGQGVNLIPDTIVRAIWRFKDIGHLQSAVVFREIRGEANLTPGAVRSDFATGVTLSGVVPFYYFGLTDRLIFQVNGGTGIARYINDLNSLGGQDAVFHPSTGELEALPAVGWYFAYEHQWKEWKATRDMKLRSSVIWSYVTVNNFDFQLPDAYHQTNRFSFNLVFSPTNRIDAGIEYIYGTRENNDGQRGSADQFQAVGIFRF